MKDLAVKYYKQLWHYLRSGLYAHTTRALATGRYPLLSLMQIQFQLIYLLYIINPYIPQVVCELAATSHA